MLYTVCVNVFLNNHFYMVRQHAGVASSVSALPRHVAVQPGTLPGDAGPRKYLLKVHNGVESANESVLDYQDQMMAAIQRGAINCPVPVHLPSDSGSYVYHETLPVRGSDGTASLAVRLLKWVEGTPLVRSLCMYVNLCTSRD